MNTAASAIDPKHPVADAARSAAVPGGRLSRLARLGSLADRGGGRHARRGRAPARRRQAPEGERACAHPGQRPPRRRSARAAARRRDEGGPADVDGRRQPLAARARRHPRPPARGRAHDADEPGGGGAGDALGQGLGAGLRALLLHPVRGGLDRPGSSRAHPRRPGAGDQAAISRRTAQHRQRRGQRRHPAARLRPAAQGARPLAAARRGQAPAPRGGRLPPRGREPAPLRRPARQRAGLRAAARGGCAHAQRHPGDELGRGRRGGIARRQGAMQSAGPSPTHRPPNRRCATASQAS